MSLFDRPTSTVPTLRLGQLGTAVDRDALIDRPRTAPTESQLRCLLPAWDEVARRPLRRDVPAVKRIVVPKGWSTF